VGAVVVILALLGAGSAQAASLQPVGGFERPIYVTSDPGNPNRLFVVERTGKVMLVENGTISVFADLSSLVSCCEGESGLFSIALSPDFDTSGRLFADYSGKEAEPSLHVVELIAAGNAAPLASMREVMTIPHPGQPFHFGGQLQFGPEGALFISTGDGDGVEGNDEPFKNAQNLKSPLGKILRIIPTASPGLGYTVPADNPFASVPGDFGPIWSLGLRNPFRFSFDRGGAGMLIGDVGQNRREEVDLGAAPGLGRGANYGWNCFEAGLPGEKADDENCEGPPSQFTPPIFEYAHGPGCAVIGGYVVHDTTLGTLAGRYLYGDVCTGELRSFEVSSPATSDRSEGLSVPQLDSFGEDSCGRVYAVSEAGVVSRLVGTVPSTCTTVATPHAASTIGIRAVRRKVRRHKRATITAFVSPCKGRKGEAVKLFQGRRHLATRHLSLACTARFRPRILHAQRYRAEIAEDATYVAASSRTLHIAIDHSKPKKPKKKKA
jgi:glucose/arabinose dehydrogenase